MPYIKSGRAQDLMRGDEPQNKGELNFVLTSLMLQYLQDHGHSYQTISDAIGAANDAAAEMRRRVLDPYEDSAAERNGDMYVPDIAGKDV